MIRVLIADDHGVIRDGLGRLIAALPDIDLTGVAADGEEAARLPRRNPDVVPMDLDMPRVDGIEATRSITGEHPGMGRAPRPRARRRRLMPRSDAAGVSARHPAKHRGDAGSTSAAWTSDPRRRAGAPAPGVIRPVLQSVSLQASPQAGRPTGPKVMTRPRMHRVSRRVGNAS